jgi:hypothetical protein
MEGERADARFYGVLWGCVGSGTMDPVTSPARKALDYAEVTLGVHAAHEQARQARQGLDAILTSISDKRDEKRDVENQIEVHELEILSDERGKHPEMSVAAMDRHLKEVFYKSTHLTELRDVLRRTVGDIEGLEYDRVMFETDIKIAVARMQELGGYLQYLAAIKLSTAPATHDTTSEASKA